MRHLRILLAAMVAAGTALVLVGAGPAMADNPNDASYWETRTDPPSECVKIDPPGDENPYGVLSNGGTAVTLHPYDASFPGDGYSLLVVKAGSTGGDGNGNAVYPPLDDPDAAPVQAGVAYEPPLNNGGQAPAVSHWIVCFGDLPDPIETSVSWVPTDGTCASTDGTLAVTFDADAVEYTGSSAGTYPAGTDVDGAFDAKDGYVIAGDAGPFSHTFVVSDAPCEEPADLRLKLTAECVVGDVLYWRVTNDNDVDVPFTWNGPGANDGSGVATASSRTYFTTVDAGGANTTTIDWANPSGNTDSTTKAHNNQSCVYHVTFDKVWDGGDAPDLDGAVLLTATSSLGTATCTSDDGALGCTYSTGADLQVPFGETYTVEENLPDGWVVVSGVGEGFTGIDGFDGSALPGALVDDVADDRFCVSDPQAAFPANLEKFCSHTVTNQPADEVVVPGVPTFVDPTCAAPGVQVLGVDDTEALDYTVTGDVVPGGSVVVTVVAREGYELDPQAPSQWEHTFDALDEGECVVPAQPSSSIEVECGAATLTFSNPVGEIADGYTAESATFTYRVDGGEAIEVVVGPNESTDVVVGFDEDTGVHTVQIGDGEIVQVESNCEPDEVTTVAPIFVDPTCDSPSAGLTLPDVEGIEYSRSGTVAPGGSVTVSAEALPGYVLDGPAEWTHEYDSIAELECEEPPVPSIDVLAFSQVCRSDVPFVGYSITTSGTDATTAKLTFTSGNQVVQVYENQPLSGEVLYPGAKVDEDGIPTDWPGWELNEAGFWVEDETDAAWRDGLTVVVEVNPTASAEVTYPPASEACLNPPVTEPPVTEPPVTDQPANPGSPATPVVVGQAGPDPVAPAAPVAELPRTGSDAGSTMVTIATMLLAAGVALLLATRRRRTAAH